MLAQSKYFLYNTAVLKNKQKWLKMQIKKIHAIVETLFLPKNPNISSLIQFYVVIYSVYDTLFFKHASSRAGTCIVKWSFLQGFINIGLGSALQDAPNWLKNNWTLKPDLFGGSWIDWWILKWTAASLQLPFPHLVPTTIHSRADLLFMASSTNLHHLLGAKSCWWWLTSCCKGWFMCIFLIAFSLLQVPFLADTYLESPLAWHQCKRQVIPVTSVKLSMWKTEVSETESDPSAFNIQMFIRFAYFQTFEFFVQPERFH